MARRPRPRPLEGGILQSVTLLRERIVDPAAYPFNIPALRSLERLELHPKVTFLVGENGSGKSTLLEAIAVAAGFNAEGGTKNFGFATRRSDSTLHTVLRLARGARREQDGFFLRAESYFNVATYIEQVGVRGYGDVPLHELSHGESFLALANHRLRAGGLYLFDEPEAALSPVRQLSLMRVLWQLVQEGSQFLVATHSPILLAFPGALIYQLGPEGIAPIAYEETEHYQVTRGFLLDRERFLGQLLSDEG